MQTFNGWFYSENIKYGHEDHHKSILPQIISRKLIANTKYFPRWVVNNLMDIEKTAHHRHMVMHSDALDGIDLNKVTEKMIKDVYECEGKLVYLVTDSFYIIGCETAEKVEIDDFASKNGKMQDMYSTVQFLTFIRKFHGKIITADMRGDTSYRLLKSQEKAGRVTILADEEWDWDGTEMHKIEFKIDPSIPKMSSPPM